MRLITLLLLIIITSACSQFNGARHTLAGIATMVNTADLANASAIRVCGGLSDPMACVEANHLDDVTEAVAVADNTLRRAQAALDELEESSGASRAELRRAIVGILACAASRVDDLVALLTRHNVRIPGTLVQAVSKLAPFAGIACTLEPEGPQS